MKTISGKVVTTAPISLSKAAKVIANFASFDNGASEAVSIYLKRASEAFDALVQFHKDLKAPHSTARKHKKHHPSINQQENGYSSVIKYEDDEQDTSQFGEAANKSSKRESGEGREKKAKLKLEDGEVKIEGDGGRVKVENTVKDEKELEEDDGVKKRDKKKRKKSQGEEEFEAEENVKKTRKSGEQGVDSAEQSSKTNKKRRKVEGKD